MTCDNADSVSARYQKSDVEMIARETLYQGFFTLQHYRFRHRLFNGAMSDEIQREIITRGNATVLLPYDPLRDQVVLIEQIRIAAYDSSDSPWLLEMVAGMMEPAESAEQVARREAKEEAGLTVGRVKPVFNYLSSPGGTTERMAVLIGEVDAGHAGGIHGLAQEDEDILVHVVSRQQAYQWVNSGRIDNAASIIALQWLQLNYAELRRMWNSQQ